MRKEYILVIKDVSLFTSNLMVFKYKKNAVKAAEDIRKRLKIKVSDFHYAIGTVDYNKKEIK
jgi:hypothetical protein